MRRPASQVLTKLTLAHSGGITGEDMKLMAPPRPVSTPTRRRALSRNRVPHPEADPHPALGTCRHMVSRYTGNQNLRRLDTCSVTHIALRVVLTDSGVQELHVYTASAGASHCTLCHTTGLLPIVQCPQLLVYLRSVDRHRWRNPCCCSSRHLLLLWHTACCWCHHNAAAD